MGEKKSKVAMNERPRQQYVRVAFSRFKAFQSFTLHLRHFNILVGPNNAGKSTVLAAFRILAAALRKANSKKPEVVRGPHGRAFGYQVNLEAVSVAQENIFYNYDDSEAASVRFRLSNGNELLLYFPQSDSCLLIPDAQGSVIQRAADFKRHFNCPIGFVPILGPVEHHEVLYEPEAARLALFNYRAARNFRNIWYHLPERFSQFRALLQQTWPGMDIEPPQIDRSHEKPRLHMFCPEQRIPREIFWAGFGFQVWCQMLTHLIQGSDASLFLIDEPDIYLHSDLQRQLLGLLRNLGPDVLVATHSTEIITDAETDDIVLINKARTQGKRINNPSQLGGVFKALGSNLNPILTQLAKTRRAVFVEGKDFQIFSRFARKLRMNAVANRSDFAVIPAEGFNPERIRSLKAGIELTLGGPIATAVILDRDYRSDAERLSILAECEKFCSMAEIHQRKEVESFLLVPGAIDRAASTRVEERARNREIEMKYEPIAHELLEKFANSKKSYVTAQLIASRRAFERQQVSGVHEATISESVLEGLSLSWGNSEFRLAVIPGKEALSYINGELQTRYGVSLTPTSIIEAMTAADVPADMHALLEKIQGFSKISI